VSQRRSENHIRRVAGVIGPHEERRHLLLEQGSSQSLMSTNPKL
jgi:hypothetical protein